MKTKIGIVDNESIYLDKPSWDCGWYWGFGYIGNKNCHYHLDNLGESDLYTNIKNHFGDSFVIKKDDDLWTFCELVETAYSLIDTVGVLGRGGSHFTNNPCEDLIKNVDEVKRINEVVLPAIFKEIDLLLNK